MSTEKFCPVSKLETLIVATDRSSFSEGAERESVNFAGRCASRLYVMTVIETNPEYETIGAEYLQKEEEEARQYLLAIKKEAQEKVPSCEALIRRGNNPASLIVHEAGEKKADMIVIGRRGRKGLAKVLMGSATAKVVGHAPCSVLVVPRAARIECRNILVATDGSGQAEAAVSEAIGIAKRCGSHLIALSAALTEEEGEAAKVFVGDAAEAAQKAGLSMETMTPTGKPHEAIVETAAGRGVDLIVIGAYGKSGLKKLLMGSTTEKVIGQAGCAVLVVKAHTKEE